MVTVIESSAALRKKKIMKRSLNFTMMVIGQSGSGRSTMINTLCDKLIVDPSMSLNLYAPEELDNPNREFQLRKSNVELEDSEGVKINLNIIDTPGFGDSMDNSKSINIIKDYLKYQFDEILVEESRLRRNPRFKDGRVHLCLYLINPTSHGLKEVDIEIIKNLGNYVNILPCITKSDSLTIEELKLNKQLIMEDINYYKLPIFNFNNKFFEFDSNDDDAIELNNYLQSTMPFSLMGSNTTILDPSTNEMKRIRQYPWGSIDVLNSDFSDLLTLKNTILITHLNDFKDFTHEILYENYRTRTLGQFDDDHTAVANHLEENHMGSNVNGSNLEVNSVPRVLSVSGNDIESLASNSAYQRESTGLDLAAKEDQIRQEEERLREFEQRVQRDLLLKREEIEARERELAEIEKRLAQQQL